ncbi:hypothetical protein J2Y45_000787 [Dyadobacter sp. BE34]|uniref:Lipoprotein n=1 Tax=Dyadobacter fermentans TaxID=94254 RepID=A0ABU1QQU3_9BACT|nr:MULTISPECIES: hypothetical protein [Dyadobacter]MDR6803517.1 hypothetical protein [Dyadobacter fermentans]MDR7041258.1 hypothetical protein [Dyadobacter sp. BE242]MDR7195661.1 hypothetical protein [Dyadobacter sp. BE34]MDR7213794.1 hypothetical protein [Dyadobacter sp. BE31]MDR7261068.1 hypothetical protein [Dyadobacter sp. BE32]
MKNSLRTICGTFAKHITILAIASIAFSACDDTTDPLDPYDYYPLEIGHYIVYDVNQEVYSAGQTAPVVTKWQEKDEVDRVASDSAGIVTYVIARSTRNSTADYWQKVKEYTIHKYPDKLLTNIDNQPFLSLTFPIDSRTTWNGNSYNNLEKQDCYYEPGFKSVKIGEQSFDNVLTVVERSDTSIINKYVTIKQYGVGVGLISDDQTAFEFCQNDDCIGSGKVESGNHKTRKIIEFGSR